MLILWGAWLGCTRPLGAHLGFFPAPKGVLPHRIRPERVDTRPEKTTITSINCRFRARRAREFHFSCVLCRSKGGVDAYAPEAAELVGAKPLHLAYARPFGRLKSPLGTSLFRCASQTRYFPSMCLEKVRPYFPAFFSRNWLNFFCGTGDSRLSFQKIVDTVGGVMYSPLIYSHRGCTINITL